MQTNETQLPPGNTNREEARAHLARQIGRLLAIAWLKDLQVQDEGNQEEDVVVEPRD